ncbi:apolipoprotein N-acyltransferase [Demequina sp. NBRC 110053]|uniref:apolipoprotein N-acyltransferase n=1 Tax=Demequina sp. NBRC 110053 TaxID=1570342 RepID=UPI0009FC23DF|nr:apolipoprotein N-acyltransferase [Demequina sp. NBRC 110053]
MSFVLRLVVAALGGLALAASFPDLGWWPLAYVALAALWLALARASAWGGFLYGWAFGSAFMLPHVWWAHEAVGAVPWLALAIASGAFYGLFGAAWAHVRRSAMLRGIVWAEAPVFAVLWAGMEQLRAVVPFGGFPWGRIAFSQLDAAVAHLAWLGGAGLVSFAVALAGALLGGGLESLMRRRVVTGLAAPMAGIAVLCTGIVIPLSPQGGGDEIRLALIQGNVAEPGLDAFANAREVTRNHRDGTLELVASDPGPIDLVVWPENAADYDPRTDEQSAAMVTESAQAAGAPVLLGTNDYSPEDGRYNTSLVWTPDGAVLDTYAKQRPAPFAEYIPIRDVARRFSPEVDRVTTDVLSGEGPATVVVPVTALGRSVTVGTVICFEVAYDPIVAGAVAAGAEVVIVQTNNASFGDTAESTQQLAMTRLRAIETGRTAVQISTVGVSGVVDPTGRLLQQTGLFTADQMYAEVPLRSDITPAVRLRMVWEWLPLIVALGFAGSAVSRRLSARYDW